MSDTFSILGICRKHGKAGFAQASSTPSVGWRCTDVVPGRGVVTVQSHGDYRLLRLAVKLMEFGHTPQKVLKDLKDADEFFDYRQIAVLDYSGRFAVHTGAKTDPWSGEIAAEDHIATANYMVGPQVVEAMSDAFRSTADKLLEERLMKALEAGRDAGGQPDGQTAAALLVYEEHGVPLFNLRVDVHREPVGELRKIFAWFQPLAPHYLRRTLNPPEVTHLSHWEVLREHGFPAFPGDAT